MYSSVTDFITAFGSEETLMLSALDDPSIDEIQDPIIQRALDDAAAELDSYIAAAGYLIPLPYVPANLRERANDIARYRLDKNRQREDVRLRYEDAIAFLKDLVAGKARLNPDLLCPAECLDGDSGTHQTNNNNNDVLWFGAPHHLIERVNRPYRC